MSVSCFKEKNSSLVSVFTVLYVFFLPLSPEIKSLMVGLLLLAILALPAYRKCLMETYRTPWGSAALALFAFVFLASFWSEAPFSMRLTVLNGYSNLLYLPILAVGFIDPNARKWSFNAYIFVMLVTCVLSFLKLKGVITLKNPVDSGEVFYNHIATGYMVSLAVYFAALLALEKNLSRWERGYYLLMVMVGSYQIFFWNTGRTGYVTYGLLMALFLLQKLPLKKACIGIMVFCIALMGVYALSPLMQVRTAQLVSDIQLMQQHKENTSLGFRKQFHEYAHSLFLEHPIKGIGTGNFRHRYDVDQPIPTWEEEHLNDPHSQYWMTLTEQGVIGFLLLLYFLSTLFLTYFKLTPESRPFLLGMLITFCIGAFTDSILCCSPIGNMLILVSALCFSELISHKKLLYKITA